MTPVFLDTVGLLAVWDTADQGLPAAAPVFLQLVASGRPLVTTPLVLYECGNAAARRSYRTAVDDLRVLLTAKGGLLEPTADDLDTAWTDYRAGHTTSAGIVDCISFAVLRRLGLAEVFTNDRHYQAAGFTILF